ncbi:MAG: chromate efflux transporter [Synechococcales cyanobacterium CRU_2_2]|nr:chromate efflux transporter [Synechococcales cyanobacterium CRU_2_2]
MAQPSSATPDSQLQRLRQLAQIFLKLGTLGFGGPQAHLALMNEELVVRRQWFSPEAFSEGIALCEMLPGPASTQMGIYSGYLRAGQLGAWLAGVCFIAPAFLIVVALSWGYFQFQGIPQLSALFFGIAPVIVAIVLAFCWKLGQKSITGWPQLGIALAVFCTTLLTPISLLIQFLVAGLVGLGLHRPRISALLMPLLLHPATLILAEAPLETVAISSVWGFDRIGNFFLPLTLFFLKVGSAIFGGGLVIIPLIEKEVVQQLNWLTPTEFINGVAIGQLSPGPVVLTAAFVGYKVAGFAGALVATIAIFTPSFAFILLAAPALQQLRRSPWVRAFLLGVTPGVLGAIAAASIPLVHTAVVLPTPLASGVAVAVAIASGILLLRFQTPTWQLVLLGAALGLILGPWLG